MAKGIKETKEMMVGINEVSIFLISLFKNGIDGSDFVKLWDKITDDEEFKAVVEKAYEGWNQIPDELEDLDIFEVADLSKTQIDYIPKFVESLKK